MARHERDRRAAARGRRARASRRSAGTLLGGPATSAAVLSARRLRRVRGDEGPARRRATEVGIAGPAGPAAGRGRRPVPRARVPRPGPDRRRVPRARAPRLRSAACAPDGRGRMTATVARVPLAFVPLDGVTAIEASAGTGKTFTIEQLYLRLVVEHGLDVDAILVVTYTK